VDDFNDADRLTFLLYNALIQPSSDDGSMTSIAIRYGENKLRLTPKSGSYFYSSIGCGYDLSKFEGLAFTAQMPTGASFAVGLEYVAAGQPCATGASRTIFRDLTRDLGITSNGVETLVKIPFSTFAGVNPKQIKAITFAVFTRTATLVFDRAHYSISLVQSDFIALAAALPCLPTRT
jgi:hypothetical protein